VLIRDAELAGDRRVDLRLQAGHIAELAPSLPARPGETVVHAAGGALLPGLHDHHTHVLAWDAARRSVDCSPGATPDARALTRALRAAPGSSGWIRGTGYHESVAGALDRDRLDRWVPDRPLRIQHRSGSLWMLNGTGLAAVGLDRVETVREAPPGVERDAEGRATGRVFHLDAWLRGRWPAAPAPDWAGLAAAWSGWGVTGVTDATPDNGPDAWACFAAATHSGAVPQRVVLMGGPDLPVGPERADQPERPDDVAANDPRSGALKIRLTDPDLPGFDAFAERVAAAHRAGRPVAVHCVTRAELVLTTAVLAETGAIPGDRIEHAGVAPPECVESVAALGLAVVTQPHFVRERGDAYLCDVDPVDRPWLYRCGAWLEAGVPLAGGTDAPFGRPDPWSAMRAAVDRRTRAGRAIGRSEALSPESALALFTTPAEAPGHAPRVVEAGARADLCLLDRPWRAARERLDARDVLATWCAGRLVHLSDRGLGINAPRSPAASSPRGCGPPAP
jgi:predicted amidohydrolase YtcJ